MMTKLADVEGHLPSEGLEQQRQDCCRVPLQSSLAFNVAQSPEIFKDSGLVLGYSGVRSETKRPVLPGVVLSPWRMGSGVGFEWVVGVVFLWKMKEKGEGLGRVGVGGTGKGTAKSMRTRFFKSTL